MVYKVRGGTALQGEIKVEGAKNSILPLIAAALLVEGEVKFCNVPDVSDVNALLDIVSDLGVSSSIHNDELLINGEILKAGTPVSERARDMRASILLAGSLMVRNGELTIPLPGGCTIGARPIDLHLYALEKMGVQIYEDGDCLRLSCEKLKGAEIFFDKVSVGATENTIIAAAGAEGMTTIINAASEPEVTQLCEFLQLHGVQIVGVGTQTLEIHGSGGVALEPVGEVTRVIPDRIEALSFFCMAAMTQSNLKIVGIDARHIRGPLTAMAEAGLEFELLNNGSGLLVRGPQHINELSLATAVFPGFPTDAQSLFMAMALKACDHAVFEETIFENRFMVVNEFRKFGAAIKVNGATAITNRALLRPSNATITDLRAGAALINLACSTEGTSFLDGTHHVKRGYSKLVSRLRDVGVEIVEC